MSNKKIVFLKKVAAARGQILDEKLILKSPEFNARIAEIEGELNLDKAVREICEVLRINKIRYNQINMVFDVARQMAGDVSLAGLEIPNAQQREVSEKRP